MPLITYIEADGNTTAVDVATGDTVMQGAVDNLVEGILAECGGSCACATCHCFVDPAWQHKVGPADGIEQDLLEGVMEANDSSRLSCQIVVTDELDGLVVRLPESQY